MAGSMEVPSNSFVAAAGAASFFPASFPPAGVPAQHPDTDSNNPTAT
jgi:hypothetical protein